MRCNTSLAHRVPKGNLQDKYTASLRRDQKSETPFHRICLIRKTCISSKNLKMSTIFNRLWAFVVEEHRWYWSGGECIEWHSCIRRDSQSSSDGSIIRESHSGCSMFGPCSGSNRETHWHPQKPQNNPQSHLGFSEQNTHSTTPRSGGPALAAQSKLRPQPPTKV